MFPAEAIGTANSVQLNLPSSAGIRGAHCLPGHSHGSSVSLSISHISIALGADAVEWLEGPHEAKKYTVEKLKAMTADYRAKTRELKRAVA